HPANGVGKAIDLNGESAILRCEVPYHQAHVLTYSLVVPEVFFRIAPEDTDIGHTPAVDQLRRIEVVVLVKLLYLRLSHGHIITYEIITLEELPGFRINEPDRTYVDVNSTLDPPSAAFLHTPPVLKAVGDEEVCGNRGDGFIPVPYFDCVEVNGHHVAVGVEFGHLNPVAYPDHIIGGDLHAGHEPQNSILKDQQDDRGHGAKGAQKNQR